MSWLSAAAIYFIIWWVVLFATLPFGLRTQDEDDDVTLGTVSSAPHGPHIGRALLRTTIVAAIVFGVFLVLTRVLGLGFDSIPRIMPEISAG